MQWIFLFDDHNGCAVHGLIQNCVNKYHVYVLKGSGFILSKYIAISLIQDRNNSDIRCVNFVWMWIFLISWPDEPCANHRQSQNRAKFSTQICGLIMKATYVCEWSRNNAYILCTAQHIKRLNLIHDSKTLKTVRSSGL